MNPCKKSGIHQPKRLRKDGCTETKKSIKFAKSNLLSVLEAEVNCPILLVKMIFNYSPIMQELRGCGYNQILLN